MATLLLGSLVASSSLTGFGLFAANLAATAVGSFIDGKLFGQTFTNEGPKLSDISVSSGAEGVTIKRHWGSIRMAGNFIWTANFKETATTTTQGGKGSPGKVQTTEYSYSLSFAISFCEGNARCTLGRVWADGKLLDMSEIVHEFYPGDESQEPDSTIEGIEGFGNVPSFRGIAYLVFTDLALEKFGNRPPQISAEIIKPLRTPEVDSVESLISSINIIPSTGEASYAITPTVKDDGYGNTTGENVTQESGTADLEVSLKNLSAQIPSVGSISLVVSQFGTDLRASQCEFKPKVEAKGDRVLRPDAWKVSGLTRSSSDIEAVSYTSGSPNFGGTPSDKSIVEAISRIADISEKYISFYPFVLMDIPSGNTLPDTETGATGQPVFPWRGRITTSLPTVDKTASAQTEIDSLFGSVTRTDFSISGTEVTYIGSSSDWGYRRMILHYAHLCAATAGILTDSSRMKRFYIGSELRGITRIRSTASSTASASTIYPGVNALVSLLEEVRALFDSYGLTGIELSYAADWSEYHSHKPDDGSNDIYFNMDALWGHPDCDFVAFDNYLPISDWREGSTHDDFGTGTNSYGNPQGTRIYDLIYLQGQIEGGENFDYYYASDSDRDDQIRTSITDGAYSEPWIFRQKDIRSWWSTSHRNRPGGVRDASVIPLDDGSGGSVDSWTTDSKKMVFSEFGVPSVNFGTNQPNVFFDPKSSESSFPYFSTGIRDDFIQRSYYEAMITYWRDNSPTVGSVTLISEDDMVAWAWDARPYPAFPTRSDVWADSTNYQTGHWLGGRVGSLTLGQLVIEICELAGISSRDVDVTGLVSSDSVISGYVIEQLHSAREMIGPLAAAYLFDAFESEGKIKFTLRANTEFTPISVDDLVPKRGEAGGFSMTRAQETELPGATRISFIDENNNFQPGTAGGIRLVGSSRSVVEAKLPIVLKHSYARMLSEILIEEAWTGRERSEISLPPNFIALDPGDGIIIDMNSREYYMRLSRLEKGDVLDISMLRTDTSIYSHIEFPEDESSLDSVATFGRSILHIMDLPLQNGAEEFPWAPVVAAYQSPYPGAVNVHKEADGGALSIVAQMTLPSLIGETTTDLQKSDPWRFDGENIISVKLYDPSGQLLSVTPDEVLNGLNSLAVKTSSGTWEIIQYTTATLIGTDNGLPLYDLSGLLRGQLGTETEIEDPLLSGASVVIIDFGTLQYLDIPNAQKNFELNYIYGPSNLQTTNPLYQSVTHTGTSIGLAPYAPTHLKKTPTSGSAEVTFNWIRRTRFGGDDLDPETVPLNEETELYDLEIYDPSGPTLLREIVDNPTPDYVYTTGQQTTDGGGLPLYLIRVYQKSTTVGRGRKAERLL